MAYLTRGREPIRDHSGTSQVCISQLTKLDWTLGICFVHYYEYEGALYLVFIIAISETLNAMISQGTCTCHISTILFRLLSYVFLQSVCWSIESPPPLSNTDSAE